jgi:Domain of unknown function (DUF397)
VPGRVLREIFVSERHEMDNNTAVNWKRSTFCGNTTCVEVAQVGDAILVRDSKNPESSPLTFDQAEWTAFTRGVAAGEFRF